MTRKSYMPKLRSYWNSAHAQSCADGTIKVTAAWKVGDKPGLLTRIGAALVLDNLIDVELKIRRAKIRTHIPK